MSVPLITQKQLQSLLTSNQLLAIQGADYPSAANVFATINDLASIIIPSSKEENSNPNSEFFYSGMQILADNQASVTISESPISEEAFFLFLNGNLVPGGTSTDNTNYYTRTGSTIYWNNSNVDGVKLKTTSYLVARYNYMAIGSSYEDTGDTTVSTWACTATNSVPTSKIRIIRFGKLINLYLMNWNALGNGTDSAITAPAGTIPTRFLPDISGGPVVGSIATQRAGFVPPTYLGNGSPFPWGVVPIAAMGFNGLVEIGVDGSITINMNADGTIFNTTSGQSFGFSNGTISWMIP